MLDIVRRRAGRPSRRALLHVGACSALGLGLPHWLRASSAGRTPRAKSVILLWLWGGPSHHETFDPKPNADAQVRGPFGVTPTRTPGFQICELLPLTAAASDRYAVVRSMAHDQKDHNVAGTVALTGSVSGAKASGGVPFPGSVKPGLGSVVARLTGARPGQWPPYMTVGPACKVSGEFLRGQGAGTLGPANEPFRLELDDAGSRVLPPGPIQLPPEVSAGRLDDRAALLSQLDAAQRRAEAADARRHDQFHAQALGLVTSPKAKAALDLAAEPARVRDRYTRTTFGQSCLLARRLVEGGVPFVQVNWSGDAEDEQQGGDGGWDLHYRLFDRMHERYCPVFDRALTGLLDDLRDRGLLESTLVLAMGEFGRSPKISPLGGREHWPFGYSALLAGGGVRGGVVYGSTDRDGSAPKELPTHPQDIHATVLEAMGLDRVKLNEIGLGSAGTPVEALF